MYFSAQQSIDWANKVRKEIANLPAIKNSSIDFFAMPSTPMIRQYVTFFASTPLRVGSQNHAGVGFGAHTGETSAEMLSEIGCEFAEVGHAERRRDFNESSELIAKKILQAFLHKLIPVLCVGELKVSDSLTATEECLSQIKSALSLSDIYLHQRILIAYEPVWAIGVAEPASFAHINFVCQKIKEFMTAIGAENSQILYGGSANRGLFENIARSVDGLFLGRSAHDVSNLKLIVKEVEKVSLTIAR